MEKEYNFLDKTESKWILNIKHELKQKTSHLNIIFLCILILIVTLYLAGTLFCMGSTSYSMPIFHYTIWYRMYLEKYRKILKYICFITYFVHFGMIMIRCYFGEFILVRATFTVPGCASKFYINAYMYIIIPFLWR